MFESGNIAIQAMNSLVILVGNTSFINNIGYLGGAMSLSGSHVTISDNAHVVFQNQNLST